MKRFLNEEREKEAVTLMKELRLNLEQEAVYLPREAGLKLIESPPEHKNGISARCRDAWVEDLWSLTSFFGYGTRTFVQAVNLLDRFLAMMKVQPKHLPCISICCLHIAATELEDKCNVVPTHELIRISQCRFTVSDLSRMQKIISEKLDFRFRAVTALTFLHLYHAVVLLHTSDSWNAQSRRTRLALRGWKEILNPGKLEAQLKACLCRLVFSRAKPSVLALALLTLEIEALQSMELLEIAQRVQRHLKIVEGELLYWRDLVAKCMAEYLSPECSKPDHRKLVWIVSRRTAQNLHASYYSVPELPTIPEGVWDESESEDSSEDMSCGEDSLSRSAGSDGEGAFFPMRFRRP